MTQWAKLSETEWAKFPDDWTPDQIKAAIQRVRAPKVDHAARLASMKAGKDIPAGVDLETPPDVSYKERVTGRLNRASAAVNRDITTPISNEGGGRAMLGELVKRGLDILGQYGSAMMSVPAAGVEKVARLRNRPGDMAGPEVEEYARGAGDLADQVLQQILALGIGKKGFKYEPRAPRVGAVPERGPGIKLKTAEPELVEDLETGAIVEPNERPTPDRVANLKEDLLSKGVNPDDPVAVNAIKAQEKGIPPATEITVGETPVSKTTIDGDNVKMDLAEGTPDEAVHETLHHEAEVKGTEHPPEDNNAILDSELEPAPLRSVDEEISNYTEPEIPRGNEMDVDHEAATGPYTGKATPAPANAQEPPGPPTTREMPPPDITKGRIGPKEKAMLDPEPPPPDLETFEGGEGKALQGRLDRSARADKKAARIAQRQAEDAAASKNAYLRAKRIFEDTVDFGNVAIISPLRTAMRNIRTQGIAGLIDNIDTIAARKIQKMMSGGTISEGDLLPTSTGMWNRMFTSARQDKRLWDTIANLDDTAEGLLESYMSAEKGDRFANPIVNAIAEKMSYVNNLQEGWTRRGVALNYLDRVSQARTGMGIQELVYSGRFSDVILEKDILGAIGQAREVTFSLEPTNKFLKDVMGLRRHAIVRLIQPFMRFSYNSGRFLYHHSPLIMGELGFKYMTNPEFIAAYKAGDALIAKQMAQAMTGTMAIGAGVVLGTKMSDADSLSVLGQKINVGPENPLSAYLVAGYLARRVFDKNPAPMYASDMKYVLSAVLNSSQKSPASEIVNQLMSNLLTESGRAKISEQRLREITGQWLARYSRLGSSLNALLSVADPEFATMRNTSEHWYDPTLANIPFVNKTLPKRYGTDYAGPVVVQNPIAGEMSGISFEKIGSDVNKELELYQLKPRYNAFPGEPHWNNEYRKTMMENIDKMGKTVLGSEEYKKAPPNQKRFMMQQVVSSAANVAKERTKKDMPEDLRRQYSIDRQTEMLMRD